MLCVNCNHELTECTCPDLSERIALPEQCSYISISPEVLAALKARAEKNRPKSDDEQQSFPA